MEEEDEILKELNSQEESDPILNQLNQEREEDNLVNFTGGSDEPQQQQGELSVESGDTTEYNPYITELPSGVSAPEEKKVGATEGPIDAMIVAAYNFGANTLPSMWAASKAAGLPSTSEEVDKSFYNMEDRKYIPLKYRRETILNKEEIIETNKKAKNELLKFAQEKQQEGVPFTDAYIDKLSEVEDPVDFVNYLGGTFGELAPQIVATVATQGVSSYGQQLGSIYLDGVQQIAEEKGITPEEVIDQGLDEPSTAKSFAFFTALLDKFGAGRVAKSFSKRSFSDAMKRRALPVIKAAEASVTESGTEAAQTILEQVGADVQAAKEIDIDWEEVGEAAAKGFFGVGTPQAISVAHQTIKNASNPEYSEEDIKTMRENPEVLSDVDSDIDDRVEAGDLTEEQGEAIKNEVKRNAIAVGKTPSDMSKAQVDKAVPLIKEKEDLKRDIEGKDDMLVTPQKERIQQIDEELLNIVTDGRKTKETEEGTVRDKPKEESKDQAKAESTGSKETSEEKSTVDGVQEEDDLPSEGEIAEIEARIAEEEASSEGYKPISKSAKVISHNGKRYKIISIQRKKDGSHVVKAKEIIKKKDGTTKFGTVKRFVGNEAETIAKDFSLGIKHDKPQRKKRKTKGVPNKQTPEPTHYVQTKIEPEFTEENPPTLEEAEAESKKALDDFENAVMDELVEEEKKSKRGVVEVDDGVFQVIEKEDGEKTVSRMREDGKLIAVRERNLRNKAIKEFVKKRNKELTRKEKEALDLIDEAKKEEQDKLLQLIDKAIEKTDYRLYMFDGSLGLLVSSANITLKILRKAYVATKNLSVALRVAYQYAVSKGYKGSETEFNKWAIQKIKNKRPTTNIIDKDKKEKQEPRKQEAKKENSKPSEEAKEKLKTAWDKWKSQQNELGIIFDPQSKAKQDVELVKALVEYLKTLGADTIDKVKQSVKDFTSGEIELDNKGAEHLIDQVNEARNKESKKYGFDNSYQAKGSVNKRLNKNYKTFEEIPAKDLEKAQALREEEKALEEGVEEMAKDEKSLAEVLEAFGDRYDKSDIENAYRRAEAKGATAEAAHKRVTEAFDRAKRKEEKKKKGIKQAAKRKAEKVVEATLDRQFQAKNFFQRLGMRGVVDRIQTVAGAAGRAKFIMEEAYDKIYKGITRKDQETLDRIIQARRISTIDQNRRDRGLKDIKHPDFTSKEEVDKYLEVEKQRLGEKKFNALNKRADEYFNTFRSMLDRMQEAGLISKKTRDELFDLDYQPRRFMQHLMDADGELDVEKIKEVRRSTGLSESQIRQLDDGSAGELIINSEWLLATALAAKEKAIEKNKLFAKIAKELPKLAKRYKEAKKNPKKNKKFLDEYKVLNEAIQENPIVGFTEQGNPKYRASKAPVGFKTVDYWVDGVKHQFFLREDLHDSLMGRTGEDRWKLTPKMSERISKYTGVNLLRAMATGVNPFFVIGNFPNDFGFTVMFEPAYGQVKIAGKKVPFLPKAVVQVMGDAAKAWKNIHNKDEVFQDFVMHGGMLDYMHQMGELDNNSTGKRAFRKAVRAVIGA